MSAPNKKKILESKGNHVHVIHGPIKNAARELCNVMDEDKILTQEFVENIREAIGNRPYGLHTRKPSGTAKEHWKQVLLLRNNPKKLFEQHSQHQEPMLHGNVTHTKESLLAMNFF